MIKETQACPCPQGSHRHKTGLMKVKGDKGGLRERHRCYANPLVCRGGGWESIQVEIVCAAA